MSASLHLTGIQLRVAHLSRSIDFYVRQLGFVVKSQSADQAGLATSADGPALLALVEQRDAPAAPPDAAGLFHAALLLPSRQALGAWLTFAHAQGIAFEGFSDHGVSEAIYFADPDGNGLEFYRDRPRPEWPTANGEIAMSTQPLALHSLLAEAAPASAAPLAGATWGHLHLRVTNLDRSEAFYAEKLGMVVTQRSYPGARFMAADGYHHHLGLNTWGSPRRPEPVGSLGLVAATFSIAGRQSGVALIDPDGMHLRVQ